MADNDMGPDNSHDFLTVNDENGGILDLLKFLVFNHEKSGKKLLQARDNDWGSIQENILGDIDECGCGGKVTVDHRWVLVVSMVLRKIIRVIGKPMEWTGCIVEFILNLLSLNGNFLGLIWRIIWGNVVIPRRDTETFYSAIGYFDKRVDLFKIENLSGGNHFEKVTWEVEMGNRALMDLCMMSSKLAYENAKVVQNIVEFHWKMHLEGFYNCWNDFQEEYSTKVFVMCDEPEDANLIVVSFRGTEPFDPDGWMTDVDYSWYNIPCIGKVHTGFVEALGLGNRVDMRTIQMHLSKNPPNHVDAETTSPKGGNSSSTFSNSNEHGGSSRSSDSEEATDANGRMPPMCKLSAYYTLRKKLRHLLQKHKNAKFVVTGHSLGGALAILFPTVLVLHEEEEMMQRLLAVYTFGQPRICNGSLARYMEAYLGHPQTRYLRVVYCNDLVPRLPYDDKTFLYKHFGNCLYYNSLYMQKKVNEEPNRNYFGFLYVIPEYANAVWELFRSFIMEYVYGPDYRETWESFLLRLVGLTIPGLSAHSPVDYVNSIRLGTQRSIEMRTM